MSLAFAIGAVAAIIAIAHHHDRAVRDAKNARIAARYGRAVTALEHRALPTGVGPAASSCGQTVCGHSAQMPVRLTAAVERYVGAGAHLMKGCERIQPGCPTTVFGRFDGFQLQAVIFWHFVLVKDGAPPAGAVVVRHGQRRDYFLGSDVSIGLVDPQVGAGN